MRILPPLSDYRRDVPDLRRFGLALAWDGHLAVGRSAAEALVERLCRQATMEAVETGPRSGPASPRRESRRVRAFAQFIRLYRRRLRQVGELDWLETAEQARARTPTARLGLVAALRMLPLELREALFIVVLARFTHQDAAAALDIPMTELIARLTQARDRLAALTQGPAVVGTPLASSRVVSHLRVVK